MASKSPEGRSGSKPSSLIYDVQTPDTAVGDSPTPHFVDLSHLSSPVGRDASGGRDAVGRDTSPSSIRKALNDAMVQLEISKSQRTALSAEVLAYRKLVEELKSQKITLQSEMTRRLITHKEDLERIAALQTNLQAMRTNLDRKDQEIVDLTVKIQDLMGKLELTEQQRELKEENELLWQKLEEFKRRFGADEEDMLPDEGRQYDRLRPEDLRQLEDIVREAYRERVEQVDGGLTDLSCANNSSIVNLLSLVLTHEKSRHSKLLAENESLSAQIRAVRDSMAHTDGMRHRLTKLEAERSSSESEKTTLLLEKAQVESALRRSEESIRRLEETLRASEDLLRAAEADRDAAERQREVAQKHLQAIERQRDASEKQRDAAERERDKAERERNLADQKRAAVEKERDAAETRAASMENELQSLKAKVSEAEKLWKEELQLRQTWQTRCQELEGQLEAGVAAGNAEQQEKRVRELESRCQRLEAEVEEKVSEILAKEEKISSVMERLQRSDEMFQGQILSLEKDLKTARDENERLREEAESGIDPGASSNCELLIRAEQAEADRDKVQAELDRVMEQMKGAKSEETREALEEAQGKLEKAEEKLSRAEERLERKDETLAEAGRELEETKQQLEATEKKLEESTARFEEKERELEAERSEREAMKSEIEELREKVSEKFEGKVESSFEEELRQKGSELEEELKRVYADLESVKAELDRAKKSSQDETEEAKLEVVRLKGELERSGGEVAKARGEVLILEGRVEELEARIRQLGDPADLTRASGNSAERMKSQIEKLVSTRNDLQERLENERMEREKAAQEAQNLKAQIQELEREWKNEYDGYLTNLKRTQDQLEKAEEKILCISKQPRASPVVQSPKARKINESESSPTLVRDMQARIEMMRRQLAAREDEAKSLRIQNQRLQVKAAQRANSASLQSNDEELPPIEPSKTLFGNRETAPHVFLLLGFGMWLSYLVGSLCR